MKATNRIDGRRADIAIAKMLRDMAYALARRQGGFRAVATAHSRHRMLLEINPLLRPGGHVTRADAEIEAALSAAAAEIARDATRATITGGRGMEIRVDISDLKDPTDAPDYYDRLEAAQEAGADEYPGDKVARELERRALAAAREVGREVEEALSCQIARGFELLDAADFNEGVLCIDDADFWRR